MVSDPLSSPSLPASVSPSRAAVSRIATAAIGLPLLALIVWVGAPWFSALVAVAAAIAAYELCSIATRAGHRPWTLIAIILAIGLVAVSHTLADESVGKSRLLPVVALAGGAGLASLMWPRRPRSNIARVMVTIGAVLYAGGLLFHAPLLRELDQGRDWVMLLFVVTFASDTGAYLVGSSFGHRALMPSVSPSKTWEGAMGGLAGGVGAAVACVYLLDLDAGLGESLLLGALLGVAGQLGDLAVSRLKRIADVKDSGRFVPGHGGLLDRLDSIVFNLVVLYYFVL